MEAAESHSVPDEEGEDEGREEGWQSEFIGPL